MNKRSSCIEKNVRPTVFLEQESLRAKQVASCLGTGCFANVCPGRQRKKKKASDYVNDQTAWVTVSKDTQSGSEDASQASPGGASERAWVVRDLDWRWLGEALQQEQSLARGPCPSKEDREMG